MALEEGVVFEVQEVKAITIDEIRDAQEADSFCQKIRKRLEKVERCSFMEDDRGLVIHVAPLDGHQQIVIPPPLRQRALHLAHYKPASGHPGISHQSDTMRKDMYWLHMAADIAKVSKECHACARERVKFRQHAAR